MLGGDSFVLVEVRRVAENLRRQNRLCAIRYRPLRYGRGPGCSCQGLCPRRTGRGPLEEDAVGRRYEREGRRDYLIPGPDPMALHAQVQPARSAVDSDAELLADPLSAGGLKGGKVRAHAEPIACEGPKWRLRSRPRLCPERKAESPGVSSSCLHVLVVAVLRTVRSPLSGPTLLARRVRRWAGPWARTRAPTPLMRRRFRRDQCSSVIPQAAHSPPGTRSTGWGRASI